jgi:hypothetical protein
MENKCYDNLVGGFFVLQNVPLQGRPWHYLTQITLAVSQHQSIGWIHLFGLVLRVGPKVCRHARVYCKLNNWFIWIVPNKLKFDLKKLSGHKIHHVLKHKLKHIGIK